MRFLYLAFIVLVFLSCQKETFVEIDSQEESSFLLDDQLTRLMQSVASHDGSFDDIIDNSSCFSINFPYQILYGNELMTINSVNDLKGLNPEVTILPVFPISISLANYELIQVQDEEAYTDYQNACDNGVLYNERIICVDFTYPLQISLYDKDLRTFETVFFDHDKETFTSIEAFHENIVANINYPISLIDQDGMSFSIENNKQLKDYLLTLTATCP